MTTEDNKEIQKVKTTNKNKKKVLENQITFDFFGGVLDEEIVIPKQRKEHKEEKQKIETKHISIKRDHSKKCRRIRKIRR